MSYHELVLKLLEGVTGASTRADVVSVLELLSNLYAVGRISDERLIAGLNEVCTDILSMKYPLKPVEELRDEASRCAQALYKAIRIKILRERVHSRLPGGV